MSIPARCCFLEESMIMLLLLLQLPLTLVRSCVYTIHKPEISEVL